MCEAAAVAEQVFADCQAISDGLARAGLRRNQKIAAACAVSEHRRLHRCRLIEIALNQGAVELRACRQECHEMSDLGLAAAFERVKRTEWKRRARQRIGATAINDELGDVGML